LVVTIIAKHVRHREDKLVTGIDLDLVFDHFFSGIIRAKNADGAEGELCFRYFSSNKEGVLTTHVAELLESKCWTRVVRRVLIDFIGAKDRFISVVKVVSSEKGTSRTFLIERIFWIVTDMYIPSSSVELVQVRNILFANFIKYILDQHYSILNYLEAMV
jgi:hypothetical protein